MIDKRISGLQNAPAEKRYKSFLNTVADQEVVWMLAAEDGLATMDIGNTIYLLVWPAPEFCEFIKSPGETAISMEVHEFLEQVRELDPSIQFMVFPTEKDSFVVSAEQLYDDIQEYLDEVE